VLWHVVARGLVLGLAALGVAGVAPGCGSRTALRVTALDAAPDSGCHEGETEPCGDYQDVGTCRQGTRTCVDGDFGACEGAVGPTSEVCNDLDDDCDGLTDEENACPPCLEGATEPCGSDVGACQRGVRRCANGALGACQGAVGPTPEVCNAIDDDCDGDTDEDFHLGEPCDGPDSDQCLDDVMTCNGCSAGTDTLEICNGKDDDCDGIVDSDCESGSCNPNLVVTGSTPSSPGCVDFPVTAGSRGSIQYPCAGGAVTATLGSIMFTGSVSANGDVALNGTEIVGPDRSPDRCTWRMDHRITGSVRAGIVNYEYTETLIQGSACWFPCTETGTVQIAWALPK